MTEVWLHFSPISLCLSCDFLKEKYLLVYFYFRSDAVGAAFVGEAEPLGSVTHQGVHLGRPGSWSGQVRHAVVAGEISDPRGRGGAGELGPPARDWTVGRNSDVVSDFSMGISATVRFFNRFLMSRDINMKQFRSKNTNKIIEEFRMFFLLKFKYFSNIFPTFFFSNFHWSLHNSWIFFEHY